MNAEAAAEAEVRAALYAVAPELADQAIQPDLPWREQFEFDSMDFLRYLAELHRRTGLDIAEREYAQLETLQGAVAWLRAHHG